MKEILRHIASKALAFAAVLLMAACGSSSDTPGTPDTPDTPGTGGQKSHGVVFFFMGSGTGLQTEMDSNIRRIVEKASSVVDDNHKIMIFYDRVYDAVDKNHDTFTNLWEVKKVNGRTKQVLVKEWNPQATSTVSPDFMTTVLKMAREQMNTDTYSLVMSSHGGGWVPSDVYDAFVEKEAASNAKAPSAPVPPTKFFGEDSGAFMEVPDLASALKAAGKWDLLLFDACFMSSVEALYDLRQTASYIIASPSEVMGGGFPYNTVLPYLFDRSEESYTNLCKAYMSAYRSSSTPSATVALVRTAGLDALAAAARPVYVSQKAVDAGQLQGYEGFRPHMFYDFAQYMTAAAGTMPAALSSALASTVVFADHPPTIVSGCGSGRGTIAMATCCGLTCHVGADGYDMLHESWRSTAWAKAVGQ